MRTRAWWVALIGVMVALCMVTSVSAATTTYTDPQGRFSFTVPDGYRKTDSAGALVAYYSPTYAGANVNVGAANGVAEANLDDTAAAILKTLKDTFKDFQAGPNGVQSATVAGKPARRYEYTATVGDVHGHGVQYLVVNGSTGYFITLTASDADFAGFVKESMIILDSFTFLTGTSAGTATTTPPAGNSPAVTGPVGSGTGNSSGPSGNAGSSAPTTSTSTTPGVLPAYFIRRLGDG